MGKFYLPSNVGLPFGNGNGDTKYLILEIHYDNPNGDSGMVDNSSFRMYYTDTKR